MALMETIGEQVRPFPKEPTIEKSVRPRSYDLDGHVEFGTLYTATAWKQGWENLVRQRPHLETLYLKKEQLVLPAGWTPSLSIYSDDSATGEFVGLSFAVPHGLACPKVPREVYTLVSAYLQLGTAITFSNFSEYQRGNYRKFLPFVMTSDTFRFFVYDPTMERIADGIRMFSLVLDRLASIKGIPELLSMAYAVIRLNEIAHIPICGLQEVERTAQMDLALHFSWEFKMLGFVYRDLPGLQDAVTHMPDRHVRYVSRPVQEKPA